MARSLVCKTCITKRFPWCVSVVFASVKQTCSQTVYHHVTLVLRLTTQRS